MWSFFWISLASAGTCSQDASFSVATLNAWGLPSPVAADRRGRMPRIARWVQERAFDVVGLQEVWAGALRLFALPGLTTGTRSSDSGLALFTPHPVLATKSRTFREELGFDSWKAKGLLTVEIDLEDGGEPLVVAVTHLQAGGSKRAAATREQQVREIADDLRDEDRAVVLLGDFNLYDRREADDRSRDQLEGAGFVDAALSAGAIGGTYPGMPDRFDRIYVRNGEDRCLETRSAAVVDPELSDHRAVEVQLEVGR
jgi:endonuclease/exonuclease/phosphatase family metal-dependent hydrolase